jgi:phosphomannomutase
MLAALHVLAALGNQDDRRDRSLSELLATYARYAGSGEVNSEVADTASALAAVRSEFAGRDGVSVDELDGLTVDFGDGSWFNVRPSNTEPLLRLNVEAPDEATMAKLRDEVLDVIRR